MDYGRSKLLKKSVKAIQMISRLLYGQSKAIHPQQHGGVLAKDFQKGVVGHITSKSLAGPGTMVVNFAEVFSIAFLQEDATPVIGVNHIERPVVFCLFNHRFQRFIPQLG